MPCAVCVMGRLTMRSGFYGYMDLHSPTLAPFLAQLRMGKWFYICFDILAISWHLVALSSSLSVIRILDYADVLQTFRRLTQLQLELHHFMAPFALQLCPKFFLRFMTCLQPNLF